MSGAATMQDALRLHQAGRHAEAEALYRAMLKAAPGYAPAMFYLGFLEAQTKRAAAGLTRMRKALDLYPSNPSLWINYAISLRDEGRQGEAERAARRALAIDPASHDAQLCLGDLLQWRGALEEAIAHYRAAVAAAPQSLAAHLALGRALNLSSRSEESIALLERAAGLAPPERREDAACELGDALALENRTQDAVAIYKGVPAGPQVIGRAAWRAALCLPLVYHDEAEIAEWRARYAANLGRLEEQVSTAQLESLAASAKSLNEITNFHLSQQGGDDRDLQIALGRTISRMVGARFPEFSQPLSPRRRHGRPRVGFVSHYLRDHSIGKTHGAWITRLDRRRFEVFAVHTGTRDAATDRIAASCEHFFQRPIIDAALFAFIRSLDLDVLIYPDLGMQPEYQILAALRLAPVQCNGLGHPVTSGLPTIDVALSSALMEPDDGDKHYSERLVRLPNTGFCYRRPEFAPRSGAFERLTDGPVFVCSQNISKLLPRQDRLFARIAASVPDAVLWFVAKGSNRAVAAFTARLSRALRAEGADPDRQLRIIPPLDHARFLAMYGAADVYLDGHDWSGCNTTYEALAVGLPVVTWPGPMMRGRHSAAILRASGFAETVAGDGDEYVELARRLALDRSWRRDLCMRIAERAPVMFDDPAPIEGLADFIAGAVRG